MAIFADLHANRYALSAFLDHHNKYGPVDRIINLGDFLQIGPHPKEVAERVLDDERITTILGNNEASLFERRPAAFTSGEYAHQEWTINKLGPVLVQRLKSLPRELTITVGGCRILLLHTRHRSLTDFPLLYAGSTLDEFVSDYADDADVVLIGHTHDQMLLRYKGKTIINPGSLGCTGDSCASYCIVEIDGVSVNSYFENPPCDNRALLVDLMESAVPEGELIKHRFWSKLS